MWSLSSIYSLVFVIISVALPSIYTLIYGPDRFPHGIADFILMIVVYGSLLLLITGFILSIIGIKNSKKFHLKGSPIAILALCFSIIIFILFVYPSLFP